MDTGSQLQGDPMPGVDGVDPFWASDGRGDRGVAPRDGVGL
ncbi:hypothetical protein [uncultured Maricaulis sp.]